MADLANIDNIGTKSLQLISILRFYDMVIIIILIITKRYAKVHIFTVVNSSSSACLPHKTIHNYNSLQVQAC